MTMASNWTATRRIVYRTRINYRVGDMWAPNLENTEALKVEVDDFIDSIEQGRRPLTDGEAGLSAVRVLEAATESMELQGRLIELGKAKGAGA